jgi:hypothetical protein
MDTRYRKIHCKMWGDEWFLGLSQPQPCAASLWIWLLTGPLTEIVPGLIRAGEATMAEAIGWDLDALRDALREVVGNDVDNARVEYSQKDKLLWIPKAIEYNPPPSPNHAKQWGSFIRDFVKECPLREKAIKNIGDFMDALGNAFPDALRDGLGNGVGNYARARDQKQEKEQKQKKEQEQKKETPPPVLEKPFFSTLTPSGQEAVGKMLGCLTVGKKPLTTHQRAVLVQELATYQPIIVERATMEFFKADGPGKHPNFFKAILQRIDGEKAKEPTRAVVYRTGRG